MLRKRRIYQYIQRFGLYHGLKIFFTVRKAKDDSIINFKIPGLKNKIFLRRQSSDFFVFEEVFIDECYKLTSNAKVNYIIDAGANIGISALYFQLNYPNAKIISIEPLDSNFSLLCKNTINYPNITCYKAGLWNKKTYLKTYNEINGYWAIMVKETANEVDSIPAISITEILLNHPTSQIDILKVDIEGSEKEVFESNTEWLGQTKNIIVEIHENMRIGATKSVRSALKDFDVLKIGNTCFFTPKK